MRALLASFLLAFFGALVAVIPAAAAPPDVVDMQVNLPDRLTVGDRLNYVITIEADAGVDFTLVQSSLPDVLEVVGTPTTTSRPIVGGRVQVVMTVQLAVFAPGPITVPPITLRYFGQDIEGGDLQTPPSQFNVTSVLSNDPAVPQPRDLKPQAEIGVSAPSWILPALGASLATLALVAALLFVRLRAVKQRAAYVPAPMATEDLPEDRARVVLDTAGAGFSLDGDYIEYYSSIGVTVRRYLTERYGFPAFALTTRELESEMLRRGLDRWQVRVASGLLEQCDSVVYASYRPAAERADADLTAAYEIVEMSRPQVLEEVSVT
jgi:hypothetical protein